jgi:hypothetical protein
MADEPELSTGMASETRDQIRAEGSGSLTDEGNIKGQNIADKGETADVQQGAIPCGLEVPDSGGSMADEPELSTSMASETRDHPQQQRKPYVKARAGDKATSKGRKSSSKTDAAGSREYGAGGNEAARHETYATGSREHGANGSWATRNTKGRRGITVANG